MDFDCSDYFFKIVRYWKVIIEMMDKMNILYIQRIVEHSANLFDAEKNKKTLTKSGG